MGFVPNTLTNIFIDAITSGTTYVKSVADLPPAVAGVITLEDEKTYHFQGEVDLYGDRIVCGVDNVIRGDSSENTLLKSTGLSGIALISSSYSLPIRFISITADVAVALNGDGTTTALDWFGVNFVSCSNIGTISNYSNFIMADSAFLSSGGLVFDGTIGTVGFSQCLFSLPNNTVGISLAETLTITRRFRVIYSAAVIPETSTGFSVGASTTLPVEGFILDTVSFSNIGTAISGILNSSDYSNWIRCTGIVNSAAIANMYIVSNSTATVISNIQTPVHVFGTSVAATLNQRFTHDQTNNALQYTATNPRVCRAQASLSLTATQNNVIGVYICRRPSGDALDPPNQTISEGEVYISTNGARPDSVFLQVITTINQGDEIYVAVENTSATNNVTVNFMNLLIEQASI